MSDLAAQAPPDDAGGGLRRIRGRVHGGFQRLVVGGAGRDRQACTLGL
jgi:hypothetical protein